MSSTFQEPGRSSGAVPAARPVLLLEGAAAAARAGGQQDAAQVRGLRAPLRVEAASGHPACAAEEADFLLQMSAALRALRAAIARWRAAPRGSPRDLRRTEVERHQDALLAVLWGASRARLGHDEWRVVERLLESERAAAKPRPGGPRGPRIALA